MKPVSFVLNSSACGMWLLVLLLYLLYHSKYWVYETKRLSFWDRAFWHAVKTCRFYPQPHRINSPDTVTATRHRLIASVLPWCITSLQLWSITVSTATRHRLYRCITMVYHLASALIDNSGAYRYRYRFRFRGGPLSSHYFQYFLNDIPHMFGQIAKQYIGKNDIEWYKLLCICD
jgi:hypothetical protein